MQKQTNNQYQKLDTFKQMLQQKQGKKEKQNFNFINLKSKLFSTFLKVALPAVVLAAGTSAVHAQITLQQDYSNLSSSAIGTYQGINFREGGFSGLYPIPYTAGKEFWVVSDRGVNVDAANANPIACRPTYDKIYAFPTYEPKIHRIKLNGDSVQILNTLTIKRPGGTGASGVLNPDGFGSTATEIVSTDTVNDCANFLSKTFAKDAWALDAEGIVTDCDGNFWICEEGGATVWKLNSNGEVISRYSPYANLLGAEAQDIMSDTVFKYRRNNRGFEGIALAPNGKIYAIIQSPIFYPTKTVGENSRIHRILEINPATNQTRMFAYVNDGIIGLGNDQIRMRDWKMGDLVAINNNEFLVIEQAQRGLTNIKRVYKINLANATPVTSGLYGGLTLEALVDYNGLGVNGIVPVTKSLFMDLLANGWPAVLDKAEGLAIINDSTIAIGNDNDYGVASPLEDGIATATGITCHVLVYSLQGANKITNYVAPVTGPSSSQSPYMLPTLPGGITKSIITVGDAVNNYPMVGIPDGLGAFDNGNGTFTVLMNHEISSSQGSTRAHGSIGGFVSKWVINKNTLAVVSGSDLTTNVKIYDTTTSVFVNYNAANPSALASFNRLCSADLPETTAFYDTATATGTMSRIFLSGEESGGEGRAFAHIVTGPEANTSYQLPYLGRFSWENAIASPVSTAKTVVVGTDDATGGQVYVYVGNKTNSGTEIDKAGLHNGKLYGIVVSGYTAESNGSIPAAGTTFTMADMGYVNKTTGAVLNTNSFLMNVTSWLRPEDGAFDPSNPNNFYFVTTNGFGSPSRMWLLSFTDITNPELGGTVTAVLDGTEGQQMLDNIAIDKSGHVLLQEDPGGQTYLAKIWQYNINNDSLIEVARHDENRFLTGAPNFLTIDEESSGIIDVSSILGPGWFLGDVQAHYALPNPLVQGGQLFAFYNPASLCNVSATASVVINTQCNGGNNGIAMADGSNGTAPYGYLWSNGQTTQYASSLPAGTFTVTVTDLYGCTAIATVVITEPTAITLSTLAQAATCGANIGSVTALPAGGTSNYTYLWSNGETSNSIIGLAAGIYTVTVADFNGCTITGSAEVVNTQITALTITSTRVSCNGGNDGSACVTAVTGGLAPLSYSWNSIPIQTTACATGLKRGNYMVTVTGADGCTYSSSILVTQPTKLLTAIAPETNKATALTQGGTKPYAYLWSNGQTTKKVFGLSNGTYTVTVTDAKGCTTSASAVVGAPAKAGEFAAHLNDLSVYPNPAVDNITVSFTSMDEQSYTITILDMMGKIVYTKTAEALEGENVNTFNLDGFAKGIYVVNLSTDQSVLTSRVVIK